MRKWIRAHSFAALWVGALAFAILAAGVWATDARAGDEVIAEISVMDAKAKNKGIAEISITDAEWRAERSILKIEGTAQESDTIVLVRDAETRAFLGSAAVRADGKWMLKIRKPKTVPCRVVAQCQGQKTECEVADAPVP